MSVIRLKNDHGEFLTTTEYIDIAITRYLPSSVNGLREVMQRLAPADDYYLDVHSVSELLIMLAARGQRMSEGVLRIMTRIQTSAQMTRTKAHEFLSRLLRLTAIGELAELDKWLESAKVAPGDIFIPGFSRAIGIFYDGTTRRYGVRLALDTGGDN
jgi:hypothetical protein